MRIMDNMGSICIHWRKLKRTTILFLLLSLHFVYKVSSVRLFLVWRCLAEGELEGGRHLSITGRRWKLYTSNQLNSNFFHRQHLTFFISCYLVIYACLLFGSDQLKSETGRFLPPSNSPWSGWCSRPDPNSLPARVNAALTRWPGPWSGDITGHWCSGVRCQSRPGVH